MFIKLSVSEKGYNSMCEGMRVVLFASGCLSIRKYHERQLVNTIQRGLQKMWGVPYPKYTLVIRTNMCDVFEVYLALM